MKTRRFPTLDRTAAKLAADDALASLEETASTSNWRDEYLAEIARHARAGWPFCSEDISLRVGVPEHVDPRVVGAFFRACRRDGLIKPTGRFLEGQSLSRHGAPVREWIGAE